MEDRSDPTTHATDTMSWLVRGRPRARAAWLTRTLLSSESVLEDLLASGRRAARGDLGGGTEGHGGVCQRRDRPTSSTTRGTPLAWCRARAFSTDFPDWIPKPKLRRKLKKSCELDVPTQKVYEVVSDVQSYDQFVPYCVKSRVLSRGKGRDDGAAFDAELQIGFRLFNESHVSRVTCKRPRGEAGGFVRAEALPGGLCDSLVSVWSFEPTRSGGCKLSFNVDFEISNPLHAAAIAGFFEQVTLQQMTAFIQRSKALHAKDARSAAALPTPSAPSGADGGDGGASRQGPGADAASEGVVPSPPSPASMAGDALRPRLASLFQEKRVQLERNYLNHESEDSKVVLGLGLPEFLLCCKDLAKAKVEPFPRLVHNTFLLASCFASFDANGDGIVMEREWVDGCELIAETDAEEKARRLHARFDRDGDGRVSASDVSLGLKGHLTSMRRLMPEILRMQERERAAGASDGDGGAEGDGGGAAQKPPANMLVLCATMDVLLHEAQEEVGAFVGHLFDLIDEEGTDAIALEAWTATMKGHPEVMDLMMLEGFLEMTELALATKETVNS